MNKTPKFCLALILFSICIGCELLPRYQSANPSQTPVRTTKPANFFVSDYYRQLRPRRVVLVSPRSRFSHFRDQEKFANALALEIRNSGIAEAVFAGEQSACNVNAIRQGQFDERELVRLSQWYNADAVMYCDVTSLSAYQPLSAHVSIVMVDTRESIVLLAADGRWDLQTPSTLRAFKQQACRRTAQDEFTSELYLQSPSVFLEFVASELARFLSSY